MQRSLLGSLSASGQESGIIPPLPGPPGDAVERSGLGSMVGLRPVIFRLPARSLLVVDNCRLAGKGVRNETGLTRKSVQCRVPFGARVGQSLGRGMKVTDRQKGDIFFLPDRPSVVGQSPMSGNRLFWANQATETLWLSSYTRLAFFVEKVDSLHLLSVSLAPCSLSSNNCTVLFKIFSTW